METSSRPERQRKKPERLTAFDRHDEEEAIREEQPQPKRRRRSAAQKLCQWQEDSKDEECSSSSSSSSSEEGSDSEGLSESESEEEDQGGKASLAAQTKKRKRGSGVAAAAAAVDRPAKPWVPRPPAEPVPAASFLATLHASLRLLERVLELGDGLRSVTLVARDAASLAIALGATGDDAAQLWRTLAASLDSTHYNASTPAVEALAAVKGAVRADPARARRCTKSAAMADYRITEKDLADLPFTRRLNPLFPSSAPSKMYSVLDCMAAAHRKWGSLQALEAAKARSRISADKRKATLAGGVERRRAEMDNALNECGVQPLYIRTKQAIAFINRGVGKAAAIAAAFKAECDAAAAAAKRQQELDERLEQEGLPSQRFSTAAFQYTQGSGSDDLDAVVEKLRAANAAEQARTERRSRMRALLDAEALGSLTWLSGVSNYIQHGTGSEQEALAYARKHQARSQRHEQIQQLLAAEGLSGRYSYSVEQVRDFIDSGQGSADGALEAARARHAEDAQMPGEYDADRHDDYWLDDYWLDPHFM